MLFLLSNYLSEEYNRKTEHIHREFLTNTRQPGIGGECGGSHILAHNWEADKGRPELQ